MGTTSDGYPYPEGTDLVVDGDDAIKALAEALTKRTHILLDNDAHLASDAPSTYPFGVSVMALTSAGSRDWPTGTGLVVTQRWFSDRVQQTFYATSSVAAAYYRSTGGGGFGAWVGAAAPYGQAVGTAQLTGSANQMRSRTVTFPSGRFTAAPNVVVALLTGTTNAGATNTEVWSSGASATSVTLQVNRSNETAVTVNWQALQASSALLRARVAEPVPDAVVTCPTEGCENVGIGIEIASTWTDDDGESHAVDAVECGVCGADITDTLTPIGG